MGQTYYKEVPQRLLEGICMRVDILYDRTAYGNDKAHMKDEETSYPCVLSVSKATGNLKLKYSTVNNGHFGIPKVIFGITQRGGYSLCGCERRIRFN